MQLLYIVQSRGQNLRVLLEERVQGSGFGVLGPRVQGSGFGVSGPRVEGSGFSVWGLRVQGLGFTLYRVQGLGPRVQGLALGFRV